MNVGQRGYAVSISFERFSVALSINVAKGNAALIRHFRKRRVTNR